MKNILDLLTSFCLVRSTAYPAASELDEQLRSLLYDPRTALSAVAAVDQESANILQFYVCGYAAVRRFYELRDSGGSMQKGEQVRLGSLARKRAAAETLVALICSAADSIYGGLYDNERESSIQVDGLLVLLGEALVFSKGKRINVNLTGGHKLMLETIPEPERFLNIDQQYAILAAVEDLQTVTPRVYDQCEECFQATLYHYIHYDAASDSDTAPDFPVRPRTLLQKSVSSQSGFSGFSLIGNELAEAGAEFGSRSHSQSQSPSQTRSSSGLDSSGVLLPRPRAGGRRTQQQRGWDWRTGLKEGMKGSDVLRILRLQLAKGLSFGLLL